MNIDVLQAIDDEIRRLTAARDILAESSTPASIRARTTGVGKSKLNPVKIDGRKKGGKRNLTPAGRAAIAAAVRRRWAAVKAAGIKTGNTGLPKVTAVTQAQKKAKQAPTKTVPKKPWDWNDTATGDRKQAVPKKPAVTDQAEG